MSTTLLHLATLAALLTASIAHSAEPKFIPLSMNQGDSETRTGMWFSPDLGTLEEVLPLKTRVSATKQSVTGGVAMKCLFEKGSRGIIAYEMVKTPVGSAGLTFYAKASRKLKLRVGGIESEVGTEWKKIDLPWERLGTTRDKPTLGWQLTFQVVGPIESRTWLILDRVGFETPAFIARPAIDVKDGKDETISSETILYGAENLAATRERARARKPFKVIALGDSVTAGAQMSRGSWTITPAEGVRFLYFAHLARLWEEDFGYKGITPVQHGHGGWTAERALTVIDKEVVAEAKPEDLVILQFGGNDMTWAGKKPAEWKAAMKKLIARARTKTTQILLVSSTPAGDLPKRSAEITRVLKELVAEEKVAAADVLRFASYRGEAFAWAWLANEGHPAYMGHILMAEMMAPLLSGKHRTYPE
jgi:lysophospholipase L1-like esterase